MERDETQIGVQVDKSLWQQFRNDVESRHGRIRGFLKKDLENALKEYIHASEGGDTHDRLRRIENKLEHIDALLSDEGKTKKEEDVSTETENKLRKIREQIKRETDGSPKVHEEVVEKAIRDNAGSSAPTIRRYKQLLQQDNILFVHPIRDSMYFRQPQDFVTAVNQMAKANRINGKEYDEILDRYGEEWWVEQLPDENEDEDRAFQ